jgi:23S rRNA pseudouridine1911/1915/1917 synthase
VETTKLQVDADGERIDRYLARKMPTLSRSQIQQLIREGMALVDDREVSPSYRLKEGQRIEVSIPPPEAEEPEPEAEPIPLDIVYEDEGALVINKPPGMVVHPAAGHSSGTLVNALLARRPELAGVGEKGRPGIVHRLDKDTSGLMVVAKSPEMLRSLRKQFKERSVRKVYRALVEGRLEPMEGIIDAPMGRDRRRRERMAVVPSGKPARTRYRVEEYLDRYTLVEVTPETGRTHQIRVHLAFIGHPVAGDPVYGRRKRGSKESRMPRQFLHAGWLGFTCQDGVFREFGIALPEDLRAALEALLGRPLSATECKPAPYNPP